MFGGFEKDDANGDGVTVHNVQIVQYLFLATQQARIYLQSSQV